jgi:hypothetical protein
MHSWYKLVYILWYVVWKPEEWNKKGQQLQGSNVTMNNYATVEEWLEAITYIQPMAVT